MSISVISRAFRRRVHAAAHIVARVQPRTSKGITDLLSLNLILLNTNCPIKQIVNLDELTYYQVTLHGKSCFTGVRSSRRAILGDALGFF